MKTIHWVLLGAGAYLAWKVFGKGNTIVSQTEAPASAPAVVPQVPESATESKPLTVGGIRNPRRQNLPKLVDIGGMTENELYGHWWMSNCEYCRRPKPLYIGFENDVEKEVAKRNLLEKFQQKKASSL